MASQNFSKLSEHLARGAIDFSSASFKILLISSALTEANLDSWVFRSAVTNEVANGNGYATGGVAIAATVSPVDIANNRTQIAYADLPNGWTAATISAVGAIIYQSTGNAATDKLLHYLDLGGTITCTNGTFGVTFTQPLFINR